LHLLLDLGRDGLLHPLLRRRQERRLLPVAGGRGNFHLARLTCKTNDIRQMYFEKKRKWATPLFVPALKKILKDQKIRDESMRKLLHGEPMSNPLEAMSGL